jgi:hypothetical protein
VRSFVGTNHDETADHVGETGRCRGLPPVNPGVDRGGQVVFVPGDLQHRPRTLVEVGGSPAEQGV